MEEVFTGSAICTVSDEGLIALPAGFRSIVRRRATDGNMLIGLNENWSCLRVYDAGRALGQFTDLEARYASDAGQPSEMHSTLLRRRFGFVAQTVMDPVGVIAVAPWIRVLADLGPYALIVATGAEFEIWDLANVLQHGSSDLKKLAKLHVQQSAANEVFHDHPVYPFRSQRSADRAGKPGLRVQQMPPVQPRHDPI